MESSDMWSAPEPREQYRTMLSVLGRVTVPGAGPPALSRNCERTLACLTSPPEHARRTVHTSAHELRNIMGACRRLTDRA
jgi:hypothetical protein